MSENRKRRRLLKLRREDVRACALTAWSRWPPVSPALNERSMRTSMRRQWWPTRHPRGPRSELYYRGVDGVSRKVVEVEA